MSHSLTVMVPINISFCFTYPEYSDIFFKFTGLPLTLISLSIINLLLSLKLRMFNKVVFPAPLAPIIAHKLPGCTTPTTFLAKKSIPFYQFKFKYYHYSISFYNFRSHLLEDRKFYLVIFPFWITFLTLLHLLSMTK